MKFATAKEHRNFFQKQGWIEFEGLLSSDQLALANQAIDQVLAERLNIPSERLQLLPSEKMYLQGRDIWRSNFVVQKLATQMRFAEIVAELIEKKPLRLGYDQFFPSRQQASYAQEPSSIYSHFLEQIASLEEVSCLRGVACGLLLALGGKKENASLEKKTSFEGIDVFPNQPGNVIFLQPAALVNWDCLYAHPGQRFYMIVYTLSSAYYQLQLKDPHTHALKRLGYVFNDKLSDKLNPIIYR
jgi:hypothetical protein